MKVYISGLMTPPDGSVEVRFWNILLKNTPYQC